MILAGQLLADRTIDMESAPVADPLVSFVLAVPSTATPESVRRLIESLRWQTEPSTEVIVALDGPAPQLENLGQTTTIRHERAVGLEALRVNEAIELARGRFIALPTLSRCWRPDALERLLVAAGDGATVATARRPILIPRATLDRVGLADPHVALREVWAQDLRDRLAGAGTMVRPPASAGQFAAPECGESELTLALRQIPRGDSLRTDAWRAVEIDALTLGGCDLGDRLRRLIHGKVVSYFLEHRHILGLENFALDYPAEPRDVGLLRIWYEGTESISFFNYDDLMRQRGSYRFHIQMTRSAVLQPLRHHLMVSFRSWADGAGDSIFRAAVRAGIPSASYLDDDIVHLHEIPDFAAFGPDSQHYRSLVEQTTTADAVWVTNDYLAEVYRPLNPRVVPTLGCIRAELLPAQPAPRSSDGPLTIAYCGNAYRVEEFRGISSALQRLARAHPGRLRFAFWGLDPAELPPLAAPVSHEPFESSYTRYLDRMASAQFDLFLVPLFEQPRCRLGKSLIKYYELALTGAIGVFSDVPPYAPLPDGQTLLKTANTEDAWFAALNRAVTMPDDERERMRSRCLEHVREMYTHQAGVHRMEAACRATEVHAATRQQRHGDGLPRVLLLASSRNPASAGWLRRRQVLETYSIVPVIRTEEPTPDLLAAWFRQADPIVVESLGWNPVVADACARVGIAYLPTARLAPVTTPWLVSSTTLAPTRSDRRGFCYRGVASAEAFERGTQRLRFDRDDTLHRPLAGLDRPLRVSVAEGASAHFLKLTREALEATPLRAGWAFDAAAPDLLVIPPQGEELPVSLLDAFASGTLVAGVAGPSPGAGVDEVLLDGQTGLQARTPSLASLCETIERAVTLSPEARRQLQRRARSVALQEFAAERAGCDLMRIYLDACGPESPVNFASVRELVPAVESTAPTPVPEAYPAPEAPTGRALRVETLHHELRYTIEPGPENWSGLDVTIFPDGLTEPTPIHLELFDAGGRLVRTATAEALPDTPNQVLGFRFPAIEQPDGRPHVALLRLDPVARPAAVRVFEIVPAGRSLVRKVLDKLVRPSRRSGLMCAAMGEPAA